MNATAIRAGFLTNVQDLGRPGFREFGVSLGGALDTHALRVANLLVGNDESAAGLEITFGGLRLRFADERIIVWCGGEFKGSIGSTSLDAGHPALLCAGEEFSLESPALGCRAWLAISGGIGVAFVLGSRATDLRAGFGGVNGRPLCDSEEFSLGQNPERAKVLIDKLRVEKVARWNRRTIGRTPRNARRRCVIFADQTPTALLNRRSSYFPAKAFLYRRIPTEWEFALTVRALSEMKIPIFSRRRSLPALFRFHPTANRFCFSMIAKRSAVIQKSRT